MNYYHAENAGRGKIGGVLFEIYGIIAGSAFGVYATEDPAQISALDSLSANPTSGVTSIPQAEYEGALKKKAPATSLVPSSESSPKPTGASGAVLKGRGAVVVEETEREDQPIEIKDTLETVDDALQLGPVKVTDVREIDPKQKKEAFT